MSLHLERIWCKNQFNILDTICIICGLKIRRMLLLGVCNYLDWKVVYRHLLSLIVQYIIIGGVECSVECEIRKIYYTHTLLDWLTAANIYMYMYRGRCLACAKTITTATGESNFSLCHTVKIINCSMGFEQLLLSIQFLLSASEHFSRDVRPWAFWNRIFDMCLFSISVTLKKRYIRAAGDKLSH